MPELKKEEKENITENENYKYKTIVQQTQSDNNRDINNYNNQSTKSVLDNKSIEKNENFSFIKFSNEEFSNTQH